MTNKGSDFISEDDFWIGARYMLTRLLEDLPPQDPVPRAVLKAAGLNVLAERPHQLPTSRPALRLVDSSRDGEHE